MLIMSDKGGTLQYKCRKCGEIDESYHVPRLLLTLIRIRIGLPGSDDKTDLLGSALTDTAIHTCKKGHIGIADLIGGYEDETE